MDRIEWERLSAEMAVAWPDALLTSESEAHYFQVLEPLSADAVADAILASVRDGASKPPAAGQLFMKARDLERLRDDRAATTGDAASGTESSDAGADTADGSGGSPRKIKPAWLGAIGAGAVVLLGAGFGIGFAISSASADDAEAARAAGYSEGRAAGDAAGFTRGQLAGYRSGRAAGRAAGEAKGYSRGVEAGKDQVWADFSPSQGEWYVVKIGTNRTIASWLTAPFSVGRCLVHDSPENFYDDTNCP